MHAMLYGTHNQMGPWLLHYYHKEDCPDAWSVTSTKSGMLQQAVAGGTSATAPKRQLVCTVCSRLVAVWGG